MTGLTIPQTSITDDEEAWLENVKVPAPKRVEHTCGNCRTPYGKSSIKCPNDRGPVDTPLRAGVAPLTVDDERIDPLTAYDIRDEEIVLGGRRGGAFLDAEYEYEGRRG
ncbi:hypothetical protein [Microbacterium binotii]|uniref:Uncharacterized protein n=1 Tax=Microbacterium binotii TaxID=462710 RepID=A0ABN3PBL8_9MICO